MMRNARRDRRTAKKSSRSYRPEEKVRCREWRLEVGEEEGGFMAK